MSNSKESSTCDTVLQTSASKCLHPTSAIVALVFMFVYLFPFLLPDRLKDNYFKLVFHNMSNHSQYEHMRVEDFRYFIENLVETATAGSVQGSRCDHSITKRD